MKKIVFSLAAVTLFFAACSKKDNNTGNSSRTAILTTAKWKLTAGTATGTIAGAPQNIDILSVLENCRKDDLAIFKTDARFIIDAGTVKCDPADAQQQDVGTWVLTDNETRLRFPLDSVVTGVNLDNSSKIDYLDYATLKLSGSGMQDFGGITYNFNYNLTLTHVQ